MIKSSELRLREVVNIADGRRLGTPVDLEVDLERGRVTALILPGPSRWLGLFGRDRDIVVTWDRIVRVGMDVILVEWGETTGRSPAR